MKVNFGFSSFGLITAVTRATENFEHLLYL